MITGPGPLPARPGGGPLQVFVVGESGPGRLPSSCPVSVSGVSRTCCRLVRGRGVEGRDPRTSGVLADPTVVGPFRGTPGRRIMSKDEVRSPPNGQAPRPETCHTHGPTTGRVYLPVPPTVDPTWGLGRGRSWKYSIFSFVSESLSSTVEDPGAERRFRTPSSVQRTGGCM